MKNSIIHFILLCMPIIFFPACSKRSAERSLSLQPPSFENSADAYVRNAATGNVVGIIEANSFKIYNLDTQKQMRFFNQGFGAFHGFQLLESPTGQGYLIFQGHAMDTLSKLQIIKMAMAVYIGEKSNHPSMPCLGEIHACATKAADASILCDFRLTENGCIEGCAGGNSEDKCFHLVSAVQGEYNQDIISSMILNPDL